MAKNEGNITEILEGKSVEYLKGVLSSVFSPRSVKEAALAEIRAIEARQNRGSTRYNSGGFSRSVSELARMEEERNS